MSKLLNIFGAKYKSIVLVALVVLLIMLLIYGSKKVSSWLDARDRADRNLDVDESNLTITKNQAIAMADRFETAMDGLGTNASSVIDSLSTLETPDDLALVIKEFGTRENCYFNGLGCERGNLLDWFEWEFYGFGAYTPSFGVITGQIDQERLEAQLSRLGYALDN